MSRALRSAHLYLSAAVLFSISGPGIAKSPVDFVRDVAPIIEQHCIRCHLPGNSKSDLSLATSADIVANEYVVPGKPDDSYLIEVVTGSAGDPPLMPKEGQPLAAEQVAKLRAWIAEGAHWPDDFVIREKPKADRSWWAFQPLSPTEPPSEGVPKEWSNNPIDRFIYAKLVANGLSPSPPADRRTLIRRVTYGLTGLPPRPEEINAFLADAAPNAYERLVDRLLASPRYGEHWARHWLDVTRFGESTGYEVNHILDTAWPFRDYVIRSFIEDKPVDRFITEHLAGDALASGDPAVEVGLTFLVCGPVDIVGNADEAQAAQIRADTVDEIIRATSEAFVGLTIGCARCHDHKFDPITQRDYYQLYATFAGVHHDDRPVGPESELRDREKQLAELEAQKKQLTDEKANLEKSPDAQLRLNELARMLAEVEGRIAGLPDFPLLRVGRFEQPADTQHVLIGGDARRKGDEVSPASIEVLATAATPYALPADAPERERRLTLARWLVAKDNPLTPRVLANRLWHYHFGKGIVATTSDFGYMGEKPTHPELLDWLARQLIDGGWRLKRLHKLIVTSQTYQQASAYREDAARVDADSRLLWRFPPRRLAAEEIRDTILFVAGKLEEQGGGPGFRLYEYTRDNVATYTPLDRFGPDTYRRSIYHQNARASFVDVLTDFDAPDCAYSVSRRVATTTPSQALALMNHSFTIDMANAFAARVAEEAGSDGIANQVDRAFALAFGREPDPTERSAALALIAKHGLRAFCRAILNASELIYVH
jgi:hypothetical protein